jgi:predicted ATP-dependent serine protease
VLGGGIVPGSLILLGGEPGIGKYALLQISLKLPYKTFVCIWRGKSETNKDAC